MTHDQWLNLKVGDVIVDRRHHNARREVLSVDRIEVRKGGPLHTRTVITTNGLRRDSKPISIFEADDWMDGVGARFVIASEFQP